MNLHLSPVHYATGIPFERLRMLNNAMASGNTGRIKGAVKLVREAANALPEDHPMRRRLVERANLAGHCLFAVVGTDADGGAA